MKPNFQITKPDDWAINELKKRSAVLHNITTGGTNWATQRTPWIRATTTAMFRDSPPSDIARYVPLWSGNARSYGTAFHTRNNRPYPGITGATIYYKGTLGSTKGAKLSFQCWTREDLEVLEKMYMVPGMTIIIEWGWSLTSKGSVVYPLPAYGEYGFAGKTGTTTLSSIMTEIIEKRIAENGNYDGTVGLVTNFSYKQNDQLGFDCEIELVSPSEMWLEFSATNTSRNMFLLSDAEAGKVNNLAGVFDIWNLVSVDDGNRKKVQKCGAEFPITICKKWKSHAREFEINIALRKTDNEDKAETKSELEQTIDERPQVYISWAHLVRTLNDNILLHVQGQPLEPGKDTPQYPHLALDIIPVSSLPKLASTDPSICMIKPINIQDHGGSAFWDKLSSKLSATDSVSKMLELEGSDTFIDFTDLKFATTQIRKLGTSTDIKNLELAEKEITESTGEFGFLNNIFINAGYLRELATNLTGTFVNVEEFLKKVLADISECFGNLWEFGFITDEKDPLLLHVVDMNYTAPETRKDTAIEAYKFRVNPNSSGTAPENLLIRTAVVESKLIAGLQSMVLYSRNTTDNGNVNPAHQGFSLYGNDIYDSLKGNQSDIVYKHIDNANADLKEYTAPIDVESNEDAEPDEQYDGALFQLQNNGLTTENIDSAKSALRSYISWLVSKKPESVREYPFTKNILLPFIFGVTMDGFSGFKWGNVIEYDYLPKRYTGLDGKGKVYFQITKINHSITLGDWTTAIETIMRLRDPNGDLKDSPTTTESSTQQELAAVTDYKNAPADTSAVNNITVVPYRQ